MRFPLHLVALRLATTAAAVNRQPLHIFTSVNDVRHPWGLLQPIANSVKVLPRRGAAPGLQNAALPPLGFPPSRGNCMFNGDKVLYIARTDLKSHSGPIEVFWVAGSKSLNDTSGLQRCVCRSVSI
eukprot:SAG11_NODE_95_length_17051_cov_3.557102_1_plen_125_part_10